VRNALDLMRAGIKTAQSGAALVEVAARELYSVSSFCVPIPKVLRIAGGKQQVVIR
jgi:hypothetical protein